jgi:antitoxin component YwqK of YwqJK toxin-antitoxin module
MYKTLIFILIVFTCCKNVKNKERVIFYTDSSFKNKKDSVFVDNLSQIKQEIYCRIYSSSHLSFEQGIISKGNKVGKWQCYIDISDKKNILNEEKIYSQDGALIKYKAFDRTTGHIVEDKNYINDNLVGIQKEFYPSGKLHIQYETDQKGHIINDFIVLSEEGKEIYSSFLGNEGSGYIKYYDQHNNVIWEGSFKNKKKEGWHHEYIIDYGGEKVESISKLYQNDKLIQTKNKSNTNKEN